METRHIVFLNFVILLMACLFSNGSLRGQSITCGSSFKDTQQKYLFQSASQCLAEVSTSYGTGCDVQSTVVAEICGKIRIPLKIFVFVESGTTSTAEIQNTVDQENAEFADAGLEFFTIPDNGIEVVQHNTLWDITNYSDGDDFLSNAYSHCHEDGVINIFVPTNSLGTLTGKVDVVGGNSAYEQSVYIAGDFFNTNWKIYAHELGHIFGLFHTFEPNWTVGNCNGSDACTTGDRIQDTAADEGDYYDGNCNSECFLPGCCPSLADRAALQQNIMSYYFCPNTWEFTPFQSRKMNDLYKSCKAVLDYKPSEPIPSQYTINTNVFAPVPTLSVNNTPNTTRINRTNSTGCVNWYSDANCTNLLSSWNLDYQPNIDMTVPGNYFYYIKDVDPFNPNRESDPVQIAVHVQAVCNFNGVCESNLGEDILNCSDCFTGQTYSISGNVSYVGGTPVPNQTVVLEYVNSSVLFADTDANGNYTFTDVTANVSGEVRIDPPSGTTVTPSNYQFNLMSNGAGFDFVLDNTPPVYTGTIRHLYWPFEASKYVGNDCSTNILCTESHTHPCGTNGWNVTCHQHTATHTDADSYAQDWNLPGTADLGEKIYAPFQAEVIFSGLTPVPGSYVSSCTCHSFGEQVILKSTYFPDQAMRFSHLSARHVSKGQIIEAGTLIGEIGDSGNGCCGNSSGTTYTIYSHFHGALYHNLGSYEYGILDSGAWLSNSDLAMRFEFDVPDELILDPLGGICAEVGSQLNISFEERGTIQQVEIEWRDLNGNSGYIGTVDMGNSTTGSFLWTVDIPPGSYQIKIYDREAQLNSPGNQIAPTTQAVSGIVTVLANCAVGSSLANLTFGNSDPDGLTGGSGTNGFLPPNFNLIIGNSYTSNYEVLNVGDIAGDINVVALILSVDDQISTDDYVLTQYNHAQSLAAGGSFPGTQNYTVPNWSPGDYTVFFVVDVGDNTPESNEGDNIIPIPVTLVQSNANCPEVTNVSTTTVTGTSGTIDWDNDPSATGFEIEYREQGTVFWTGMSVSGAPYTFTGLSACTTYEVRITALCSGGQTSVPVMSSFQTSGCSNGGGGGCTAPANLYVDGITPNDAQFHWDPVPGATEYQVYIIGTGTNSTNMVSGTDFYYNSGLDPCTQYTVHVTSYCNGTQGGTSTVLFTTLGCANNEPDLIINVLGTPAPAYAVGDVLDISYEVCNIGTGATYFNSYSEVNIDNNLVTNDGYEQHIWEETTPIGLAPGQCHTVTYSKTIGPIPNGNYYLFFSADFYDQQQEGDEGNNNVFFDIEINDVGGPTGFAEITSPNGGEVILNGQGEPISWVQMGCTSVTLEYSLDNGITWSLISSTAQDGGGYFWFIPTTVSSSTALVRVTCNDDPTLQDVSDNVFSILPTGGFPANNNPCSAQTWSVSSDCSFFTTSNIGASPSGVNGSCGTGAINDVWYKVTVPSNGIINVNTQQVGFGTLNIQAFSGNCNNLQSIACETYGGGQMPSMSLSGLNPGSQVHIRFWFDNGDTDQFGFCINNCGLELTGGTVSNASCGGADGGVSGIQINNSGVSFTWRNEGNTVVGNNINLNNVSTGFYELTASLGGGCSVSQTYWVGSQQPLPTTTFGYTSNNLSVSFVNTTQNATSYQWNFGDGNNSNNTNPNHTYSAAGSYTVTLTATNSCGSTNYSIVVNVGVGISNTSLFNREYDYNGTAQYNFHAVYTSDGFIIGVGYKFDSGDNQQQAFITKFDLQGAVIWSKKLNENPIMGNVPVGILATSDGGAIVSMSIQQEAATNIPEDENVNLIRVSGTGNLVWLKTLNNPSNTIIYRGRFCEVSGDFMIPYISSGKLGVSKINSAGSGVWHKEYTYNTGDAVLGLTSRNLKAVSGGVISILTYDPNCSSACSDQDAIIMKSDNNGNSTWSIKLDNANDLYIKDVVELNGAYYLIGYNRNSGVNNNIVIKLNNSGSIIWKKQYAHSSGNAAGNLGMINSTNDGVVVYGYYFIFEINENGNVNWAKEGPDIYIVDHFDHNNGTALYSGFRNNDFQLAIVAGNGANACSDNSVSLNTQNFNVTRTPITVSVSNPGINVGNFNYYSPGNVSLTPADICPPNQTVTCNLTTSNTSSTPETCNQDNGSATVTATNGTTPYAYTWDSNPVQNTQTATGLSSGTYTVTVQDAQGCTATDQVVVGNNNYTLNIQSNITHPECAGENSGSITLTLSGGSTPYQVIWNNGMAGTTLNNLGAGAYSCTVTDAAGCTNTANFTLNNPNPLSINVSNITNTLCGTNTGSATATATGGTGQKTITWSTGATGNSVSGLVAGIYTANVQDANGCVASQQFTITDASPTIQLNANVSDASCAQADGSIFLSVTGAAAPYTVSWSNGASGTSLSNLSGGNYAAWVTDANGCVASGSWTVNQPDPVNFILDIQPESYCFAFDGQAAVTITSGSGNYSVTWIGASGSGTSVFGLYAGDYSVIVTDNLTGCSAERDFSIGTLPGTEPVAQFSYTLDGTNIIFNNLSTDANQYAWDFAGWAQSFEEHPTYDFFAPGTYEVCLTASNDCGYQSEFCQYITLVQTDPCLDFEVLISALPATCGENNGSVSLTVLGTGQNTFQVNWSGMSVGNVTELSDLAPGFYSATVNYFQGGNCIETVFIEVGETPAPEVIAMNEFPPSCPGEGGAIEVVATGATPFTYHWSHDAGLNGNNASGLIPGAYEVTVEDNMGCSIIESFTIQNSLQELDLNISSLTNAGCDGSVGSVSIQASGGTTPYSYTVTELVSGTVLTGDSHSNLNTGTYLASVIDDEGCEKIISFEIQGVVPPQIVETDMVINENNCQQILNSITGLYVAGGMGPYTYRWEEVGTGQTVGTNSVNIYNISGGDYNLTVTDAGGCATEAGPFTINASDEIQVDFTNMINASSQCNQPNGSIMGIAVQGGGAMTYEWRDQLDSIVSTNLDLTGMLSGIYSLIIYNDLGCQQDGGSFVIENSNGIEFNYNNLQVTAESCGQANGAISGITLNGQSGYTYEWLDNQLNFVANTLDVAGLNAGNYYLNVSNINGCAVLSIPIFVPATDGPLFNFDNTSTQDATCGEDNGSITGVDVMANGNYSVEWSAVLTNFNATELDIYNLPPDTYLLFVTDSSGCESTMEFNIGESPEVELTLVASSPADCTTPNGSIEYDVSGGTGAVTVLNNGNIVNGSIIENLSSGNYQIIATDDLGCSDTLDIVISNENNLNATVATGGSLCGQATGYIEIFVDGGQAPFQYDIGNGFSNNNIFQNISAGSYTVSVQDDLGCIFEIPALISDSIDINPSWIIEPDSCNLGLAAVTFTVQGGNAPFQFTFDGVTNTDGHFENLTTGIYPFEILDVEGCMYLDTLYLNDNNCNQAPWIEHPGTEPHTIVIDPQSGLCSNIGGVPLELDDWIGIFFRTSNGDTLCSNAEQWNGGSLQIPVYGNSAIPPNAKNGFDNGETFIVKVWKTATGEEFTVNASYIPIGGVIDVGGVFINADATDQYSFLKTSGINCLETQRCLTIHLEPGMNIISSYIIPDNVNIEDILQQIINEIIIVKSDDPLVSWVPGFNTPFDWDFREGYRIQVMTATSFEICGVKADPETPIVIEVDRGIHYISYLKDSTKTVLSEMGGFMCPTGSSPMEYVKNPFGYIYAGQNNNPFYLIPTEGYYVLPCADGVINYTPGLLPPNFVSTSYALNHFQPTYFNSGHDASLLIPYDVVSEILDPGDEIAVFDADGKIAGSAEYKGENLILNIWGDEISTSFIEGLNIDEKYTIKIWKASEDKTYETIITLNDQQEPVFKKDAIHVLAGLQILGESTPVTEIENVMFDMYPNPASSLVIFDFNFTNTTNGEIEIISIEGKLMGVQSFEAVTKGRVELPVAHLAQGTYWCRVKTIGNTIVEKLVIIR